MSDLVKRLRDGGETCGIDRCKTMDAASGCLCAIAANRIEQLELALKIAQEELEFLDALREAGVDNWSGYDEAVEILEGKDD